MVKELGLAEILDSVQAENVKERENGFANLRYALDYHRKKNDLQDLKDKSIHHIFEVLFQVAFKERSNYAKATRPTVKSTSASRLSACAAALRSTTIVLVHRIRLKTLRAYLGHVVQVLPYAEEGLCIPMSGDYVKALATLLEYQPHVEHLSHEDWCTIVDFCLEAIIALNGELVDSGSNGDSLNVLRTSDSISQRTSGPVASSQRGLFRSSHNREIVYGLVHCLRHLTSSPSAPLLQRTSPVFDTLSGFLASCATTTSAHVAAFATLNSLLIRNSLNNASFVAATLQQTLITIRSLWHFRDSALRDQLLIAMVALLPHLERQRHIETAGSLFGLVEALLDEMHLDYIQNEQRDRKRLVVDDLCFSGQCMPTEEAPVLSIKSLSLHRGTTTAEYGWTVLSVIGFIVSWLDKFIIASHKLHVEDEDASSRKRLKPAPLRLQELFSQVEAAPRSERNPMLQIALFAISHRHCSDDEIETYVQIALAFIGDSDRATSSWASLVITELATQKASHSPHLLAAWTDVWRSSWKNIVSAAHCRISCHLLALLSKRKLVSVEVTSANVQHMVASANLHGPSLVCDASIDLWTALLTVDPNQSATQAPYIQAFLDWLLNRWQPSNFENRGYARQLTVSLSTIDLLTAFHTILGTSYQLSDHSELIILGDLGQAWKRLVDQKPLFSYLFLLENEARTSFALDSKPAGPCSFSVFRSTKLTPKDDLRLLSFLISESDKILDYLPNIVTTNPQSLNSDMVQVLGSFCIVASHICGEPGSKHTYALKSLKDRLGTITDGLCEYLSRSQTSSSIVQDLIASTLSVLPNLTSVSAGAGSTNLPAATHALVRRLSQTLSTRRALTEAYNEADATEFDEFETDQDSQALRIKRREFQTLQRHELGNSTDRISFCASIEAYITLVASFSEFSEEALSPDTTTENLTNYLVDLSPSTFLATKPFLQQYVKSGFPVSVAAATRLLDYVKENFLSNYDYERGEVPIDLCLQMMRGFLSLWSDVSVPGISDDGADLFDWFVDNYTACSPRVQDGFSTLLSDLLDISPDYGRDATRPSVRTILLSVLRDAELSVQCHIADAIPKIFGKFVLSRHEAIFDDVHDALPRDESQQEGIALRLLILAKLGSSWRTLLRRSVYHIFETAGSIHAAIGHAKLCMKNIAASYSLASPRELLMLFKSQLLFTWLDKDQANQMLDAIPYAIFDFKNLRSLLASVQSEIVSQLAMRGDAEQIHSLERLLGTKMAALVLDSFGQTMAYVFAKDASIREADQNRRLETYVLDLVGQAQYLDLIERELAHIIAHSLDHLQNEDQIAKYFAKRDGYGDTAERLDEIKALGGSNSELPLAQQPSFKARYFPDTLSRIARRLRLKPGELWTAQNVVVIVRMLLDGISDALGSLHARRILIRLDILVSLAPHVACSGYPLQQLIHGIRPLTTDQHCAPDAVCLMQHLFTIGQESLKQSPQFMLGTTLVLQMSMKTFLVRPQEATTQESEHLATTVRVERFQKWLSGFTEQLVPPVTASYPETSVRILRNILKLAQSMQSHANASKDSNESSFLKLMLSDIRNGRPSLSPPFRKLCFEYFCRDFSPPRSYLDDIFGSESTSERYMQHIWESCKQYNLPQAYLQWAAKALGRAFGSRGRILSSMGAESQLKAYHRISKNLFENWSSDAGIIRNLVDCLEAENPVEVGAAESAFRQLFNAIATTDKEPSLKGTVHESLIRAFAGTNLVAFSEESHHIHAKSISELFQTAKEFTPIEWVQDLAIAICTSAPNRSTLKALTLAVSAIPSFAQRVLPFIVHLALIASLDESRYSIDEQLSKGISQLMGSVSDMTVEHTKAIINCLLYLRTQNFPGELTRLERASWIQDMDLEVASMAATRCGMFKTATLLLEDSRTHSAVATTNPRNTAVQRRIPSNLLLDIFRQVDEPDYYYGIEQPSNLASLASRLDFEGKAIESLMIHGAEADSLVKSRQELEMTSSKVLISLSRMNLNTITQKMGYESGFSGQDDDILAVSLNKSALKLRNWDLPTTSSPKCSSGILYKALQSMSSSDSFESATRAISQGLLDGISVAVSGISKPLEPLRQTFATLCALAEVNDLLSSHYTSDMTAIHDRLRLRETWMAHGSLEDVSTLLCFRESFFGTVASDSRLQNYLHLSSRSKLLNEVAANLQSSRVYRLIGSPQDALANVVYLSHIAERCDDVGLHVNRAIQLETARVLWERGEHVPSIKMLQDLQIQPTDSSDAIEFGQAGLLATLAQSTSEARLEKPDEIMSKYLKKALEALDGKTYGDEAGRVFHEFASYCHVQLTSSDFVNEIERSEKFRRRKRKELQDLDNLSKGSITDQEKHRLRSDKAKVKKWLSIDDQDYRRIKETRDQFLRQSLENYLMSLSAWNQQDDDVLRFFALWLEHANEDAANDAVGRLLGKVPSRKFVLLLNQLASRLQDKESPFQAILTGTVSRICYEHPYHGMNYIFAGSKTEGGNDPSARSRHSAATKIAVKLQNDPKTSVIWSSICKSNDLFIKAASAKTEEMKQGSKLRLKNFNATKALETEIPALKVPPLTTIIPIREDLDYASVPTITSFGPQMTIAGGISTPKILTAFSSTGTKHVQLYKAGGDDLRQDAIMEQVFEQVSALLRTNKATRQRNLRIRTYKVVPLNANAGAIEFVSNTTSFNDYLNDAHVRYHPSDLRWNTARRKVDAAKELKLPARVQVYKDVAERFSPVLRHFFFENFEDPDEWFATRLAYTRSTAAMSILGYILGLGDRHCQNILLDRGSGEVVHIDLGVAFEAGRILNIPEVVPFRLTRDVVDGFGITRTEGVFRRCCEFTLEALRANKDAIMTLLNVLRYDPLYSWSVSPLRAKKLQQEQEREMAALAPDTAASVAGGAGGAASITSRTRTSTRASAGQEELRVAQEEQQKKKSSGAADISDDDEGGEADRALSVVEKKLATGLSVEATVHELIQQATDERNLAVLFCGWAAFA